MNQQSHRHHYIPRFLIRQFSDNELSVNYYNKKIGKFQTVQPENIFVFNDLYRNEKYNPNNPVELEEDFAKFEARASKLIREKLLKGERIKLTFKEHEFLLIFIVLMILRSKKWFLYFKNLFINNPELNTNSLTEETFISYWRINISLIAKCQTIEEIKEEKRIDHYFQTFLWRFLSGNGGKYLIIAERRGSEDFFMSDGFPYWTNVNHIPDLIPYIYFPISPERILIIAESLKSKIAIDNNVYSDSLLSKPSPSSEPNTAIFTVKKIYEKTIRSINDNAFQFSSDGCVVKDINRFFVASRRS